MPRKRALEPVERNDEARIALAEKILGRTFTDRELLRLALTHPSAVENGVEGFYERLEFLGDSVLGFIISEEAFRRFPDMREGGMTRIKVSLVAGSVLSAVARDLGLADALIVGDSERGTGGRGLTSALENTYEALTAAIYLDAGLDVGATVGAHHAWASDHRGRRIISGEPEVAAPGSGAGAWLEPCLRDALRGGPAARPDLHRCRRCRRSPARHGDRPHQARSRGDGCDRRA